MDLSTVNLQAEFRKFLFGYLEVVVTCKLNFENRNCSMEMGMDLSTINLQAEFRKFLFGYLEVVVVPAN